MAGALLGVANHFGGELERETTQWIAPALTYGVCAAAGLLGAFFHRKNNSEDRAARGWLWMAGVPAALGILLLGLAAKTELGMAGAAALLLLGQVAFGLIADASGAFMVSQKVVGVRYFAQLFFTLLGAAILIFFARN